MSVADYCAEEVRRHDYDRWLTVQFAPAEHRPVLYGLYAFNYEVAKTREAVSEPMVGEIRLQWWRETIAGLYAGEVRNHPVAEALAQAVATRPLARADFEAVIEGRSADLYDASPKRFADLLDYADATGGQLSALAVAACGETGVAARRAALAVGRAWALAGLIRALGFQGAMRRSPIPEEALEAAGIAPSTVFRGALPAELMPTVARMADAARDAVAAARAEREAVAQAARAPLLLATLAEDYLKRLDRAGGDPFAAAFEKGPAARLAKLGVAALRGRY